MVYVLVWYDFWGKFVINGLVYLLLILLFVVIGYLLLIVFGCNGVLGGFLVEIGIVFVFCWSGVVLVVGIMVFFLIVCVV